MRRCGRTIRGLVLSALGGACGPSSAVGDGGDSTSSDAATSAAGPSNCDPISVSQATLHDVVGHATPIVVATYQSVALFGVVASSLTAEGTITDSIPSTNPVNGRWELSFTAEKDVDGQAEPAMVFVGYVLGEECPFVSATLGAAGLPVGIDIDIVPDSPEIASAYQSDATCEGLDASADFSMFSDGSGGATVLVSPPSTGEFSPPTWTMTIAADGTQTITPCG